MDDNNGVTYNIDFYSNDWRRDLMIEADLFTEGQHELVDGVHEIDEDPTFVVTSVTDSEDLPFELSEEELRRVTEILCNVYWNTTLY